HGKRGNKRGYRQPTTKVGCDREEAIDVNDIAENKVTTDGNSQTSWYQWVFQELLSSDLVMDISQGSPVEHGRDALAGLDDDQPEWREDLCVICFEKCFIPDSPHESNSNGKIDTSNLLSLMDAATDDGPEVVTVCITCAVMVGKLQAFQDELTRIQSCFKSARAEIVSKILNCQSYSAKNFPLYNNTVHATLCSRK
ncbi:unnamed protein product, partial [Allacma fusca]